MWDLVGEPHEGPGPASVMAVRPTRSPDPAPHQLQQMRRCDGCWHPHPPERRRGVRAHRYILDLQAPGTRSKPRPIRRALRAPTPGCTRCGRDSARRGVCVWGGATGSGSARQMGWPGCRVIAMNGNVRMRVRVLHACGAATVKSQCMYLRACPLHRAPRYHATHICA